MTLVYVCMIFGFDVFVLKLYAFLFVPLLVIHLYKNQHID